MSKSNHLLTTLYALEDSMIDVVDNTRSALSCVVVETKSGKLPSSQASKIKDHFSDGYASRATLTKLLWKYIKDNELNSGKTITLDSNLKELNGGKGGTIDMLKVSSLISNGIDKNDVIKL